LRIEIRHFFEGSYALFSFLKGPGGGLSKIFVLKARFSEFVHVEGKITLLTFSRTKLSKRSFTKTAVTSEKIVGFQFVVHQLKAAQIICTIELNVRETSSKLAKNIIKKILKNPARNTRCLTFVVIHFFRKTVFTFAFNLLMYR